MKPVNAWPMATLYLCTDARRERGDLAEFADAALAGGVDIIQLRDKGSPGEQRFGPLEARRSWRHSRFLPTRRAATTRCWRSTTGPISRWRRAPTCCTSARTTCRCRSRATSSAGPLIGRSTHDARPGERRGRRAVDYFCVGPCWPTPDQAGPPGARPGPGPRRRRSWPRTNRGSRSAESTNSRVPDVIAAGARRIVVVRAITGADDPQAAAQRVLSSA